MIEQFEDQSECGQVLLFDSSVIVALECLGDDRVDFSLGGQQILFGPSFSNFGDDRENAVAMAGVGVPLVPVQIATEPSGGRTDAGKM
jgi:hypothetical protein